MKRRRALLLTFIVVFALCAACGWWLHIERRQYRLNRQLIAALEDNNTATALMLVNVGADPNTRYAPPPAPSLNLLLNQLLHRSSSADDSPTAFMLACGTFWIPGDGKQIFLVDNSNDGNLPLLEKMLAHGANPNIYDINGNTPMHNAVNIHCAVRTPNAEGVTAALLAHGASINFRNNEGYTPFQLAIQAGRYDIVALMQHKEKMAK
jgi:ankyrin repeat protein